MRSLRICSVSVLIFCGEIRPEEEFRAGLERALQLLVVRCLSVARYETSNQGTELGQPTQSRHRKNWDEGVIDLFIADFECRRELETLTRTEVEAACKRLSNFFEASLDGKLAPDVTSRNMASFGKSPIAVQCCGESISS